MKIVFSTFNFWPGVVTCLDSIKSVVQEQYPEANIVVRNFDTQNISFTSIKELKSDPPDYLFVGGWDSRIKTLVQNTLEKTKVILMWCSPVTQIELSGETNRFFDVWNCLETGQIDFLAIPLETDYESLKILNKKVIYFPVYMDDQDLKLNKIENKKNNEKFIVDMFCAPCARKNILAQMIALSHHKDKAKLHINYKNSSNNSQYIDAASRILSNFENFDWMNRQEYLKKIQESDFCMQVSLSESFNYVAAEHMYYGIPTILSKVVPYSSDSRISQLVVDDHQNIFEISRIIGKLCNDKEFYIKMSKNCREVIVEFSKKNKSILENNIKNVIG